MELVLVRDFSIDALNFNQNKMAQSFANSMFWHFLISTVNKPARVTGKKHLLQLIISSQTN